MSETSKWLDQVAYETLSESNPKLIEAIQLLLDAKQTKRQIMEAVKPNATPLITNLVSGAISHMKSSKK